MTTSTNALCIRYVERYMPDARAETVQRWAGVVRKDLFGLVDCVVLRPGLKPLFVQNCSEGSLSAHRKKAYDSGYLELFLSGGVSFELWEWRRKKGIGEKKKLWRMRVQKLRTDRAAFEEPSFWCAPLFTEADDA